MDAGEEIIGTAGNPNDIILANQGISTRPLCTNCKNKIHCISGAKKSEPVEILRDTCTNQKCLCRCRTHYVARNGKLRKLGEIDNTNPLDGFDERKPRNSTDDLIDKMNAKIKSAQ